jgi:hypothetical protein
MAVLVIARTGVTNSADAERWDKMMRSVLPTQPGFIIHGDGVQPDRTHRVVQLWNSRGEFDAHFNKMVRPNLPPDVDPEDAQFVDLSNLIRRGDN